MAALLRQLRDGAEPAPAAAAALIRRFAAMRLDDADRRSLQRVLQQATSLRRALPGFRKLRVLVIGNLTLDYLIGALPGAGAARALQIDAQGADYDAAASLEHDRGAALPAGPFDAAILVLGPGWLRMPETLLDAAAEDAAHQENTRRLQRLAGLLRERTGAPVMAATFPDSHRSALSSGDAAIIGSPVRTIAAANRTLAALAAEGLLHLVDLAGLAVALGRETYFDPVRYHLAKLPFSMAATPAVADAVSAVLAAMAGTSGRVLVLDLDNTLWGGVVADDGLEGIVLGQGSAEGEAFLAIQRLALALRARGIPLAVCTKNTETNARAPFAAHPDMLIREEHLAAMVANFEDKARNLERIAAMLDVGVSSLVFLDDNPAEREQVRRNLPFVMVPEIGEDPAHYPASLLQSGYLEHLPPNVDDLGRADGYRARATAQVLLAEAPDDYDAYLASLDMRLSIAPFDAVGRQRIASLIQKSNQFNLTTRRYGEPEVEALSRRPDRLCWQVRLSDRFTDHGMISVVIVDTSDPEWEIDTWLMSCRVLKRGVEEAVMDALVEKARASGAASLRGSYVATARNGLVADFYPRMGFESAGGNDPDGAVTYRLTLASWASPPARRFTAITRP
jgi:FkbH-like protein